MNERFEESRKTTTVDFEILSEDSATRIRFITADLNCFVKLLIPVYRNQRQADSMERRALRLAQLFKKLLTFAEPEVSLSSSRETATGPYTAPDEANAHHPTLFPHDPR